MNNTDIVVVKKELSDILHVKKIYIDDNDKQWSDMPEEMDNVEMGSRYNNKVNIKVDKQKNLKKVNNNNNNVSEKDYVENTKYFPNNEVFDNVGKYLV